MIAKGKQIMDAKTTEQAFANICDRICSKNESDPVIEREERRLVAHLAMVAWNTCVTSKKLKDAEDTVLAFAREFFDEEKFIVEPLLKAVSIKWQDFREDKTIIENVEYKRIGTKACTIAHLRGERFVPELGDSGLSFFLFSPGVEKRLKLVPQEKHEEEQDKMQVEYNQFVYGEYDLYAGVRKKKKGWAISRIFRDA